MKTYFKNIGKSFLEKHNKRLAEIREIQIDLLLHNGNEFQSSFEYQLTEISYEWVEIKISIVKVIFNLD